MWRVIASGLLLILGFNAASQYDSTWYEVSRYEEILSSQQAQDSVNPINFDVDFLNLCVFHATNEYRIKKKKKALEFNQNLHDLAKNYQKTYENKKFSSPTRYQKRMMRTVYEDASKKKFKGSLLNVNAGTGNILNYNGKKFFYNSRDESTDLHLFYGDRPKSTDKDKSRQAIPKYTYAELARDIVKSTSKEQNKINNKSKAYRFTGVYVMLDYKTLYRKAIPQIKVITIFGGYQTDLIKIEE